MRPLCGDADQWGNPGLLKKLRLRGATTALVPSGGFGYGANTFPLPASRDWTGDDMPGRPGEMREMYMTARPRLLITLGDVAGVGPEIVVRAWPQLNVHCRPI